MCTSTAAAGRCRHYRHRQARKSPCSPSGSGANSSSRTRRRTTRLPDGAAEDDPAAPLALAACAAADARKASDVTALRVSHLTSATSFFVSMVGRSKAQINAIVKNVEDEVEEKLGRKCSRQGKAMSGWVCLDYDSVVVNVFSEAQRDYYGIEKYWAAAQPLDLSEVLVPGGFRDGDESVVAAESADVDDWEMDDWSLDDWDLDDEGEEEDEEVEVGDVIGGGDGPVAFDFTPRPETTVESSDDDLFGDFGAASAVEEEVLAEAAIATEEEEEAASEAAEALLDEFMDADPNDEAAWALGDERLREIVERAERGARAATTEGGAKEEEEVPAWRKAMMEDGFSEADLEKELALDLDEEDDETDKDYFE